MSKILFKSIFVFLFGFAVLIFPLDSHASTVSHIVISQIQVGGSSANGGAGNEFVELYNPTQNVVNLAGWRLREENSTGSSFANLISSMSGTIASHGYYLVGSPSYKGLATIDAPYSASSSAIPANGTILLYSDNAITLVDKVGMGTASDFEVSAAPEPANDGSIQRKVDETFGHGLDTDNNANDFEQLINSAPRNSHTLVSVPTPTANPTNTPVPSQSPAETIVPTQSTSPTFTPTISPSSTPAVTATPTEEPTSSPVSTPTVIPTPASPTPSEAPDTSHQHNNGHIIEIFNFRGRKIVCKVIYRFVHKRWFFGFYPEVVCTRS